MVQRDFPEKLAPLPKIGEEPSPPSGRAEVYVDGALYPDLDSPPTRFEDDFQRADYLHRVATGWDIGIMPENATFELLRGWKDIFDRFAVPLSPGYHALRAYFGWEPVPIPPGCASPEPLYLRLDRMEERPPDPCEETV